MLSGPDAGDVAVYDLLRIFFCSVVIEIVEAHFGELSEAEIRKKYSLYCVKDEHEYSCNQAFVKGKVCNQKSSTVDCEYYRSENSWQQEDEQ